MATKEAKMYVGSCEVVTSDPGAMKRGKPFDTLRGADRVFGYGCNLVILTKKGHHTKVKVTGNIMLANK